MVADGSGPICFSRNMSKIIEGRFRFPQKARLKFNHEILKQLSRIQITAAPSFILIKESLSSSITALVFITPTPAGSVSVTKMPMISRSALCFLVPLGNQAHVIDGTETILCGVSVDRLVKPVWVPRRLAADSKQ